jgi:hypothetical protein
VVVAGDVDDVQFLRLVGALVEGDGMGVVDEPVVLHMDEAERRVHFGHVVDTPPFRAAAQAPVETRAAERLTERNVAMKREEIDARREAREVGDG